MSVVTTKFFSWCTYVRIVMNFDPSNKQNNIFRHSLTVKVNWIKSSYLEQSQQEVTIGQSLKFHINHCEIAILWIINHSWEECDRRIYCYGYKWIVFSFDFIFSPIFKKTKSHQTNFVDNLIHHLNFKRYESKKITRWIGRFYS